jgi:hypothetical protein
MAASASIGTSGVRQRLIPHETEDPDWDPNLPYGGKVYLARKKKPDPLYVTVIEVHLKINIHMIQNFKTRVKPVLL